MCFENKENFIENKEYFIENKENLNENKQNFTKIRQKLNLDCISTVKGVGYKFEL